jgi:restriction system protein
MAAEVESLNSQLASDYEQIDSLLAATLSVDDYVDLEQLRSVAVHPAFDRQDLEQPHPLPPAIQPHPEPQWIEPPVPKGLSGALGGKKRHEEARVQAWAAYCAHHQAWQAAAAQIPALQLQQMQAHQEAERQRESALADARRVYNAACARRQAEVDSSNRALDELISGLKVGAAGPVNEYVSIVLGNSVYPPNFPVDYDFEFDAQLSELTITVLIPGPEDIPRIKGYKYTKATDEISSVDLTAKQQKDRYSSLVNQVALRSLHEIFEADRRGCIQTISLTVSTNAIDRATGRLTAIPLAAVPTDRATFGGIDLKHVEPDATLKHLGALISKNPHGLVPVDTSKGVRSK